MARLTKQEKATIRERLMVGKAKKLYDAGYNYEEIAQELDIANHEAAIYVKLIEDYYKAKQTEPYQLIQRLSPTWALSFVRVNNSLYYERRC